MVKFHTLILATITLPSREFWGLNPLGRSRVFSGILGGYFSGKGYCIYLVDKLW